YLKEDKIIFPCDIFSTHIADKKALFISELEDEASILEDYKVYYKLIMDPHRRYVLPMVDVVKNLDIKMIAPSHGYILDQNIMKYVEIYEESAKESKKNIKTLILFNTMSGNTKKMAR